MAKIALAEALKKYKLNFINSGALAKLLEKEPCTASPRRARRSQSNSNNISVIMCGFYSQVFTEFLNQAGIK
jgi:hypothetical protein